MIIVSYNTGDKVPTVREGYLFWERCMPCRTYSKTYSLKAYDPERLW